MMQQVIKDVAGDNEVPVKIEIDPNYINGMDSNFSQV